MKKEIPIITRLAIWNDGYSHAEIYFNGKNHSTSKTISTTKTTIDKELKEVKARAKELIASLIADDESKASTSLLPQANPDLPLQ